MDALTRWIKVIPAGPVVAVIAIVGLWAMGSSSKSLDRVPDLAGLHLGAAETLASASGYTTRVVLVTGPGVAGTVLEHRPAAGALLARGSAIELDVTRGARQVGVPDVRGLPVDDARRILREAGLEPGDVLYREYESEPHRVVATEPRAGTSVDAGTSVVVIAAAP